MQTKFLALTKNLFCLLFSLFTIVYNNPVNASAFQSLTSDQGLKNSIIRSITDHNDLLWVGTLKGVYKFDGYEVTQVLNPNKTSFNEIRTLLSSQDKILWIGTKNEGLFFYADGLMHKFEINLNKPTGNLQFLFQSEKRVYAVFEKTLIIIEGLVVVKIIDFPLSEPLYSGAELAADSLVFGTQTEVILLDLNTVEFTQIPITSNVKNRRKHVLHRDTNEKLWLGRSDGLYIFEEDCRCFKNRHDLLKDIEIYTLDSDAENLWIGTNKNGLFRVNHLKNSISQFDYDNYNPKGINDISVISIHIKGEILWLGTFNGGVNFIDLKSLSFGAIPSASDPFSCMKSLVIHDVYEESESKIWVATNQGVTLIDLDSNNCIELEDDNNTLFSILGQSTYSFYENENSLLVTGSSGVAQVNFTDHKISLWSHLTPQYSVFFMFEKTKGKYVLGTSKGLYLIDNIENSVSQYKTRNGEIISNLFYSFIAVPDGFYFGSSHGLFHLSSGVLNRVSLTSEEGVEIKDIAGLSYDKDDGLIISADQRYLLQIKPNGSLIDLSYLISNGSDHVSIYEILQDHLGNYWMSSDNGIYKFMIDKKSVFNFKESDGLQGNGFMKISSHKGKSGKLYFGGRQGFNAFYPEDITINETPPRVIITEVSQLNKPIDLGEQTLGGFVLDQPINQLENIELGYKDLAIGFEFAALDYADSSRNQYAYRLLGFNDDWSYVGADDRKANYTNLDPGSYTFQVKAANKDGVWNPEPKELAIRVYPAPWFSPWAYAAYVLIILASIWGFIRYKTIASRKRAEELEVTVTERTQEVVQQKRMVESLLDHKNEVFANVTHEFKTPLALILGPVDEMSEEPELKPFAKQIDMVQRNANRLLLMVGQILKLSQAEQDKEVIRESQAVQPTLLMLYESFVPLAKDKDITITLDNEHDVNIYATAECLETVVGNLLSNAVKYTPKGGAIHLQSSVKEDQVTVVVSDNGPGIKAEDQNKIFNRFTRLEDHKTIQGTGIGLSVVKEVTEANKGYVNLISEAGQGARFSVTFPITQMSVDGELSRAATEQLVSNVSNELVEVMGPQTADDKAHATTVLIIEDNLDMQQHTANVLEGQFNCLFADRGELGIALALKEVPDIIICDVMMPGMDGYQVTRILRHDERTSHIPIILLTALNTKESRIKGWREKIDRYMTKPFDGTELIVQLESMLSIRRLLQEKTNQVIADQGSLSTLDLPKQDQKFIEKLQDVIMQLYANEYIQKADLADKMAISERQLQRKVKALIGVGPLDMLRDFRLEQSKLKLKDGYQVGQVSDDCGFSSVSYFGTCFKKKYGMTPKQYQQLD